MLEQEIQTGAPHFTASPHDYKSFLSRQTAHRYDQPARLLTMAALGSDQVRWYLPEHGSDVHWNQSHGTIQFPSFVYRAARKAERGKRARLDISLTPMTRPATAPIRRYVHG